MTRNHMVDSSEIGIAVIGAGRAGMIHARNFASGRIAGAELAAWSSLRTGPRRTACRELGWSVACATIARSLADPAVRRRGGGDAQRVSLRDRRGGGAGGQAHPLREADGHERPRSATKCWRPSTQAGVKLQIGFMRRFDAGFVAAKQRVEAGEIGRVVLVKSLTHGPTTPKPWMYDIRQSNGPLSEVNSHDIDTVRWFSGSEFEEVYAIGGNYRSPEARRAVPGILRQRRALGAPAEWHAGVDLRGPGCAVRLRRSLRDPGRKGLITVGGLAAHRVTTHTAAGSTTPVVRSWTDLFLDAYRAEDEDFVGAFVEDGPPRAGGL